jgi:hypothetical protein
VSALDDPGLLAPRPMPLRQPLFWLALAALSLLLLGLATIALPDSMSGQVMWELDSNHGARLADVVGVLMLASGSVLIWIVSLIHQWQYTH